MDQQLTELDLAIQQLIISHKFIENSHLERLVGEIAPDFPSCQSRPMVETFKKINSKIRNYSFEIRTVIIREASGERKHFHGFCNASEDDVSREFGSHFQPDELKFFTELASRLVIEDRLTTHEACTTEHVKPIGRAQELLNQFQAHGWIKKNTTGLWILAPRTYLELTNFLRGILSEEDEEIVAKVAALPQIIFH